MQQHFSSHPQYFHSNAAAPNDGDNNIMHKIGFNQ